MSELFDKYGVDPYGVLDRPEEDEATKTARLIDNALAGREYQKEVTKVKQVVDGFYLQNKDLIEHHDLVSLEVNEIPPDPVNDPLGYDRIKLAGQKVRERLEDMKGTPRQSEQP